MKFVATAVGSLVPDTFEGHVHSTFAHGANILVLGHRPQLVTLHSLAVPEGPSSIRTAGADAISVPLGSVARLSDGVLRVTTAVGTTDVSLLTAKRYDGSIPARECDDDSLAASTHLLWEAAPTSPTGADVVGLAHTARVRVYEALGVLGEALFAGDAERTARLASSLIGLGPGLTPSGDDALIGLLAARRCLGVDNDADACLRRTCMESSRMTTFVSSTFLAAAARGQFARPMRDLAMAVGAGREQMVRTAACAAFDQGATSGTDGVAGFAAGLCGYLTQCVGS